MMFFQIGNLEMSKATGIDPSLISRYVSGHRTLKANSKQAEVIAEYILNRADTSERIEWLTETLEKASLPDGTDSVSQIKTNLTLFISSDGTSQSDEPAPELSTEADTNERGFSVGNRVVSGTDNILVEMERTLLENPENTSLDVFLTSDRIRLMADAKFAAVLRKLVEKYKKSANIVVCVSDNTRSFNKIIDNFMPDMVDGSMQFYIYSANTTNVAEQMYIIAGSGTAVMITEAAVGQSEPMATFILNSPMVEEMHQSFNATFRYSQKVFSVYNDSYTRHMIEALYAEYCLPGALAVIKDSINPMYMSIENYCRVLKEKAADDGEYAWQCNEYRRFKDGFNAMLSTGMLNREIISLKRLNCILNEGGCQMAGLYFMTVGFFTLDIRGCRDILNGYIEYLQQYKNFELRILDDLPQLHHMNCWHVKKGISVAINDWNGSQPVMVHTSMNQVVQEFQMHYDDVWEETSGILGNRAYIISILQKFVKQIDEKYGL